MSDISDAPINLVDCGIVAGGHVYELRTPFGSALLGCIEWDRLWEQWAYTCRCGVKHNDHLLRSLAEAVARANELHGREPKQEGGNESTPTTH